MLLNTRKQISNQLGFTLIELIVTLLILSIIAYIAMPRYIEYRKQAEINADIATCKVIYDTILVLNSHNEPINNIEIGNLIDRGYPQPQTDNGVAFTYTLTPIIVKTSTPGVQYPKN